MTQQPDPSDPNVPPGAPQELGDIVRSLRTASGMSLNALAGAADVSSGLLSQIERGNGNPSYSTLIKLAQALGVGVGEFFGGQDPRPKQVDLVRASARRRLLLSEHDLSYELLTPSLNGQLGMIRAEIGAGWSNESAPFRHDGEECVIVVAGSLVVVVGGHRHELLVGDTITYDASIPHWYANRTAEPAVLIGAMTPPSF
ncbi:transcriptional regulator, XRE family with cupin sensor [Plantibacter sp. VKM Ac-1784]|uniref:Transcriptional regulator, XRE family with cupin sensor n=1 Tax=Plantibacter elymi (nom. nud.) TaxID=199708 RepID=A0ABY1RDV0_9MICO|nr:XRE family transcriptional regulator [Plantibacter sp. VKM Ac-1784]SMQ71166.1 transcriptional regulator, XRE family with cupin sensor [Plantibacter sp. VKM Ac-1784]